MSRKEMILSKETVSEILRLFNEEKMPRKDIAAQFNISYRKVCDLIRFSNLDTTFTKEELEFMEDYIVLHKNKSKVSVSEFRGFFPTKPEYTIRNKRNSIYRRLQLKSTYNSKSDIPRNDKIIMQSTAVALPQEPMVISEVNEEIHLAFSDTHENRLPNETDVSNDTDLIAPINEDEYLLYPSFDDDLAGIDFENEIF